MGDLRFEISADRVIKHGRFPSDQLAALRASRLKWHTIAQYLDAASTQGLIVMIPQDGGIATCALCQIYLADRPSDQRCHGCPVYAITGLEYCTSTPFDRYCDEQEHGFPGESLTDQQRLPTVVEFERARQAAHEEVKLLDRIIQQKGG